MKTLSAILVAAALASGCASSSGISRSEELLDKYEPYLEEPVTSFTAFRQESCSRLAAISSCSGPASTMPTC